MEEGIKGNHHAGLIEERFSLELATADGPTATISTESEQGFAVLQLKKQGVLGKETRGRCACEGGLGGSFIGRRGGS